MPPPFFLMPAIQAQCARFGGVDNLLDKITIVRSIGQSEDKSERYAVKQWV